MSIQFTAEVMFTGFGPQTKLPTPNTFCLTEQEYNHDMLKMEFWGGDVNSTSLTSGTPIQVNFGRPPQLRSFYGYVNHASRTTNSMAGDAVARNATCVYAVGASWPMKQVSSAVYQNMTTTQIIQQIAAMFNLDALVVPSSTVWTSKQQGGLSYWQFCVQLAQEIGYTFFCDGIQLVAVPRQTNPNSLTNLAAVYNYRTSPSSLPIFNPTLGSNSPAGGQLRNRQIAGIDVNTNQPFVLSTSGSNTSSILGLVQETPPFNDIEQFVAHDQSQAMIKLQGVSQLNQLYLTAVAVGPGDSSIMPSSLIFVQNSNGSQNGLWFTTGVEHNMNALTYAMTMQLGRDSLGETATVNVNPSTSFPPAAVLRNGSVWAAA